MMMSHQSHLTNRLANVFDTVGPENEPQSHANPLVTHATLMNPADTPLPQEDENVVEDQSYFEGTFRKIAPPDWEFHQVTEHNGDATSHWTYSNQGDITTYPPEIDFVARDPSHLKLWHVSLYHWYQINRSTEEETYICDFYVNNATQLCHYENPMHQHMTQQLVQINNELNILPPFWRREKTTSGKSDRIMIEPGTVFTEMAMIHEQKWLSKLEFNYIDEVYANGETTNIHRLTVTYANTTAEYYYNAADYTVSWNLTNDIEEDSDPDLMQTDEPDPNEQPADAEPEPEPITEDCRNIPTPHIFIMKVAHIITKQVPNTVIAETPPHYVMLLITIALSPLC